MPVWANVVVATLVISLASLVGVFALYLGRERMRAWLLPMVGVAAGALLGNVFLELLPEAIEGWGEMTPALSGILLGGLLVFFLIEQGLRLWQSKYLAMEHGHEGHVGHAALHACEPGSHCDGGVATLLQARPYALIELGGDLLHNLVDGLAIGAAFQVNTHLGIATSLAVFAHEIPHEFGSFFVLVQAGLSVGRALLYNFLTALTAVLGGLIALLIGQASAFFPLYLIPFTAGSFLYLALADLFPELHAHTRANSRHIAPVAVLIGIALMWLLGGLHH